MKVIDRVSLIYLQNGRLLTARTRGKTAWFIPGGKREAGESDLETLTREIKEELGVDIVPGTARYYGTFTGHANGKDPDVSVKLTCYTAALSDAPRPSSEIEELRWLTTADMEIVPEADKPIYQRLHDEGQLD